MNRKNSFLLASLLVLCASAQPASAQQIRNYSDTAESQYGTTNVTMPGAPVKAATPTTTTPTSTTTPTGEAGKEGEVSYSEVVQFQGGQNNVPASQLNLKPEEMYHGVIPGTRDSVDHLGKAAAQKGPNQLVWVGFQPRENSTRVFFQTTREANYTMSAEGTTILLTFSDTKLSAANFGRFVDTSFFNRNVTRIETAKKGKNVEVRITLRQAERPQVNTTDQYVYLEFAPTEQKNEKKMEETNRALDE